MPAVDVVKTDISMVARANRLGRPSFFTFLNSSQDRCAAGATLRELKAIEARGR